MSDQPLISVERLSKRYLIGHEAKQDTLVDTMSHGLRGLLSTWRRRRARTTEEFWALRDINFTVAEGEVVGIVGRNGAGKSTLLKLLSRITEPTSGRVTLRGRVASLLEVGTGFHPELSGRDNIFLNGAILGMSRVEIRRRFDEIVSFAEVERFLDTPVKRYSSGMYVRLAFAVAAHLEPEILIIDEVLAVGDAQFQQKCLGKMQSVASNEGRTVLFVSHSMQAITTLCSRGIFLKEGKIAASGSVPGVVSAYLAAPGAGEATDIWRGQSGDDTLQLTQARLIGGANGVFPTHEPVELEIQATVLKPVLGLVVAVEVWSGRDQLLAYTAHDDALAPPAGTVKPGSYVWRLQVPQNTFASGSYEFRIDIGIHNVRSIVPPNSVRLRFSCENLSGIGRRFQSNWTQLFRPAWHWETVCRESAPTALKPADSPITSR